MAENKKKLTNGEYWGGRVAKETWRTYNSLEERNRQLLEMYQGAGRKISDELYEITEKAGAGKGVTLSDMHKFGRLKHLRGNIENIIEGLGNDVEGFARGNMQEGFQDTYRAAGSAIGGRYTTPNKALMDEMLDRPWRGDSFSSRLWKNAAVLTAKLNDDLVTGLQQGKTIAEISINLSNKMQQGFNVTHRLVRTETMHYLNSSALRSYQDRGITHVQIWVADDERTCEECMRYHEKIYPIKKAPVLPFHAHCRCTYLPVVDEELIKEVEKPDKPDTIKNIDIDDMKVAAYGKNIDDQIMEDIYKALKPGERTGEYYINEVVIDSIPSSGAKKALMQIVPVSAGAISMIRLNINSDVVSGKTLSELDEQIKNSPDIVADDLKEAAIHEAGHAKLIAGLSIPEIEELYQELSDQGIPGISKTAKMDGAEAIAEIEVLLSRGKAISDEAMGLYNKYMKWSESK